MRFIDKTGCKSYKEKGTDKDIKSLGKLTAAATKIRRQHLSLFQRRTAIQNDRMYHRPDIIVLMKALDIKGMCQAKAAKYPKKQVLSQKVQNPIPVQAVYNHRVNINPNLPPQRVT